MNRFFAIILAISCFVSAQCLAAPSSIIIDAQSGQVLSEKNADALKYPASLTKMMTLYITFAALEKGILSADDMLTVSRKAANRSPSKLGLRRGEKIAVKDAVSALIVKSANDCATALAEGIGYSEENFVTAMNEVAKELGMKNTVFQNASGLPNRKQKTTARDMAILSAAIYHHFPQYYKLFAQRKFTFKGYTHYTHNRLLRSFEGMDGLKTGWIEASGFNIATSAVRNGKRVIAVTLGHKTAKKRDKAITQDINRVFAMLSIPENTAVTPQLPKLELAQNTPSWAINVGQFSNYAKARNYAENINLKIARKFKPKYIEVEALSQNSAVLYMSKLSGFAQNDAHQACNYLKNENKSCMVLEPLNKELKLAKFGF